MKVGDRVKVTNLVDNFNDDIKIGMVGVIVDIRGVERGIELDNFSSGHNCNQKCNKPMSGWYIHRDGLELIEASIGMSSSSMKELMDKVLDLEQQLELAKKELKDRL